MENTFCNKVGSKAKVLSIVLFFIYLAILAYLVFFSSRFGRTDDLMRNNNLKPFKTINNYIKYREYVSLKTFIINIFGNIVAFMPMGLLVPTIFKTERRAINVMLISALASNMIEILQYFFNVGAFDIDDIILNTLGGFLGYIVFKIMYWGYYSSLIKNRRRSNP
jgi:glycopeptide antibiotics resistance protein